MCGQVALAQNAAPDPSDQPSDGGPVVKTKIWSPLRVPSHTAFRKSIPVFVSMVLLVCAVSYVKLRGRSIEKAPAITPAVGVTAPENHTQTVSAPNESHEPPLEDASLSSAEPQEGSIAKTSKDDPSELWSRVRHGNPEAEVALAKLYLKGTTLERNCEQAHLLLLAASRKQSKAADALLAGDYAQQCP